MNASGIYAIRHTASGRTYVGCSVNIRERWFQHKSLLRRGLHLNKRLQNAWTRDGEAAFEFAVLEIVSDVESLHTREQAHLDDRRPLVYNVGTCARAVWLGVTRGPTSAATKAKLRAATLGKPKPWLRGCGRPHTEQSRALIQASALRRQPPSEETREKMRESARRRGNTSSFEARSLVHRGREKTQAHREAISAGLREAWARRKAVA